MDKRFMGYFGKNVSRKIYVIGIALIVAGFAVAYLYWAGYGVPIMMLGVVLFFIGSAKQVSAKDLDGKVAEDMNGYINKHIDRKTLGKEILDGQKFSAFSGYIRESGNVRFRIDKDGKVRTANYYVTAISADKKDCKVFTSVYDFMSEQDAEVRMISTKGAEEIQFSKEPVEFPKGNFRCRLKVTENGESRELLFFVPDDALADKLLSNIK